MLHVSLITLALFSGILVGPFSLAQTEPDHHQVTVRTAMAPDGRFAVAWVDSVVNLSVTPDGAEFEMFVRFFEHDGNPLTEAQQITKVADTNRIYWPELAMDTAGNAVLLWVETRNQAGYDEHVRFRLFDRDGAPLGSARTVTNDPIYPSDRTVGLSRNSQGEFAVIWAMGSGWIWVRRYAADGTPQGEAFLVHGEFSCDYNPNTYFICPGVALNDAGDLVATWLDSEKTMRNYPRFQVFDAQDSSVLPWAQKGHRLDDGGPYGGSRPEPHWLDNDRFVAFWLNRSAVWLVGRGYSDRGLIRYPMRNLVYDKYQQDSLSVGADWADPQGRFSTALSPDDRFALTHTRIYMVLNDTSFDAWYHQAGALGDFEDNSPMRRTTLFEYSSPYEEDTAGKDFNVHAQAPAVAACDDRIVWVYSRFNPDTIFEAYVLITDWDMGVGVAESVTPPVTSASVIKLETTLNRLSYDVSGEAVLILYSADGRRILEETIEGKGTWVAPIGFPSGVYFARVEGESAAYTGKVVLVR